MFDWTFSYQPMKAIAVVAIAEGLALGQVVAAGLFLGLLFLGTGMIADFQS